MERTEQEQINQIIVAYNDLAREVSELQARVIELQLVLGVDATRKPGIERPFQPSLLRLLAKKLFMTR